MANIEIKKIDKDKAIEFVHLYHYSKIMPRLTKYYLGLFENKELIGVVTLGWGVQPLGTIRKLFYNHELVTNDYIEIGKMCFHPSKNKGNFGSQSTAMLVKWVKENTDCLFLYTMADGIMGKTGIVYQASNFRYIGKFTTSVYMDTKTGEKIHPRSAKKLLKENEEYEGKEKVFWLSHAFCEYKGIDKINGLMFRYIYSLSRKAKAILRSYKEYDELSNPKDKDLVFTRRVKLGKFEEIDMPEFNMNVFNYNYQKY